MAHSLTNLATEIDRLVTDEGVSVTETNALIVVRQLGGQAARVLVDLFSAAEWQDLEADDEGGHLQFDQLTDDLNAVTLRATKPKAPEGVDAILTQAAFRASLERPAEGQIVWVWGLDPPFETNTVRYSDWGDETEFSSGEDTIDPRRVVRVLASEMPRLEPLGRWLLREPLADVPALWKDIAAPILSRSISQEIETNGDLLFRGPPPARFSETPDDQISDSDFSELQRSVSWVFENDREVENRHALLSAEIARSASRTGCLGDLAALTGPTLESAKIAYSFGLAQQSQDALKALSDLRKSVSDETVKLAEATRSLASAVAGAAIGNFGLLIARFTLPSPNEVVKILAVVLGVFLAVYVAAVIWNGKHFLNVHRDLRKQWKQRLYRHLSTEEYNVMVEEPIKRSERGFKTAAWLGGILAIVMLFAVVLTVLVPLPGEADPMTPNVEKIFAS